MFLKIFIIFSFLNVYEPITVYLFFVAVICDLTKRDKSLNYAKCPVLLLDPVRIRD